MLIGSILPNSEVRMAPEPEATICWRGVIPPSLTAGELCPLISST